MATVERHRKHGCFLVQACCIARFQPAMSPYLGETFIATGTEFCYTHLFLAQKLKNVQQIHNATGCDGWTTPISLSVFVYCVVMLTIRSLCCEKSFFWVEWPWTTIKDYIHLTALQGLQASTGTCTKPRRGAEPHFNWISKYQQDMVLLGHPTLELLVDTFTTFKPGWWTIHSG